MAEKQDERLVKEYEEMLEANNPDGFRSSTHIQPRLANAEKVKLWLINHISTEYIRLDSIELDTSKLAKFLYENQPDCLSAITRERRAEACFDIAETLCKAGKELLK